MIKYELHDLLWVIGLIALNIVFYGLESKPLHYIIVNFIAIATMLVVGNLNYKLSKV